MRKLREKFWLWLFLKAGTRLFEVIAIYNPDHDLDQEVKAVHFGKSNWDLVKSMRDYLDERDAS